MMNEYAYAYPRVGIGVILVNHTGQILIGKRKGHHAPYFSIPGGHLECGETFEEAAIREMKEETNLDISTPKVLCITNNLCTYREEGKHVVSVCLVATAFSGELQLMEPDKCEGWQWCDPLELPMPHFEASRLAVACYLEQCFYKPSSCVGGR
jgi:8-oxo-dGTP diphosphatase